MIVCQVETRFRQFGKVTELGSAILNLTFTGYAKREPTFLLVHRVALVEVRRK